MEYIRVTKENLEQEHICCAISSNKDIQVSSKKAWLSKRFDEGLVFLKSTERGKGILGLYLLSFEKPAFIFHELTYFKI